MKLKVLLLIISILFSGNIFSKEKDTEGFFNKLVAPGKLSVHHKELESFPCLDCHTLGQGTPEEKCLECHTNIADDLKKKKGLHGLETNKCIVCHGEHKGRDLETTLVDEENFDHHKKTGFKLELGHGKLECKECHVNKRKQWAGKEKKRSRPEDIHFYNVSKSCNECHQKDSPHNLQNDWKQKQCLECHSTKTFKKSDLDYKFDHDKDTDFRLDGEHKKTDCLKCHIKKKDDITFHEAKKDCLSCHKDYHKFGEQVSNKFKLDKKLINCQFCHNESTFKKDFSFDHSKDTRFKVEESHEKLNCKDCHKLKGKTQQYHFKNAEGNSCVDCHKDKHNDFKEVDKQKSCVQCHNQTKWDHFKLKEIKFDHKEVTKFDLEGKHRKTQCIKCHVVDKSPKYHFAFKDNNTCINCHNTPHQDQFSEKFNKLSCNECHGFDNFNKKKEFEHNKTGFNLKHEHLDIDCNKCHGLTKKVLVTKPKFQYQSQFLFPTLEQKNCNTCHKDPHDGSLGPSCNACHNERGFKHTSEFHKDFKLSGIHKRLRCTECHFDDKELSGVGERCITCHQKDDAHNMTLPNCKSCHGQNFWEKTTFSHSMSNFPLKGSHRTLDCNTCHGNGLYKGKNTSCVSCHSKDRASVSFPNHQLGSFNDCKQCHNQFSFK